MTARTSGDGAPTMTDEEILAHYRHWYPHITVTEAKALRRNELQFGHLGRIKVQQERLAEIKARNELRDWLFGVYSVDDEDGDDD
jgi:hypothetical protein